MEKRNCGFRSSGYVVFLVYPPVSQKRTLEKMNHHPDESHEAKGVF